MQLCQIEKAASWNYFKKHVLQCSQVLYVEQFPLDTQHFWKQEQYSEAAI